MENNFEKGQTVYNRRGIVAAFVCKEGERFIVQPIQTYYNDHGDILDEEPGEPTFWNEVFAKAPVAKVDEELAAKHAELERIKEEIHKTQSEARNVNREIEARLAKFKKYKGLEYLEDYIDGKIKFVFAHRNERFYISDLETVLRREDRGYHNYNNLKLVSIGGDSKGDLTWRVSQYSDGSGSSFTTIIPCQTEAEAQGLALQHWENILQDFEKIKTISQTAIDSAAALSFVIPATISEYILNQQRESLKVRLRSMDSQRNVLVAQLEGLR